MYTSDIDAETALQHLGISMQDLQKIVDELVEFGMLKSSGEDEIIITDKGKSYIVEHMKNKLG
jgi:predicted transcriptional regulator